MEQKGKNLILSDEEERASGLSSPIAVSNAQVAYGRIETRAIQLAARADELAMSPVRADRHDQAQILGTLGVVAGLKSQFDELLGLQTALATEAAVEGLRRDLS